MSELDLRTCKPGDELLGKHGVVLKYVKYVQGQPYPHIVAYPDGQLGSRLNNGQVFKKDRLEKDEDIVEIIG